MKGARQKKPSSSVEARVRRHKAVRAKVHGSADRPRLSVYRSNNHIYAQVIDDDAAKTVASASSLSLKLDSGATCEASKARPGQPTPSPSLLSLSLALCPPLVPSRGP